MAELGFEPRQPGSTLTVLKQFARTNHLLPLGRKGNIMLPNISFDKWNIHSICLKKQRPIKMKNKNNWRLQWKPKGTRPTLVHFCQLSFHSQDAACLVAGGVAVGEEWHRAIMLIYNTRPHFFIYLFSMHLSFAHTHFGFHSHSWCPKPCGVSTTRTRNGPHTKPNLLLIVGGSGQPTCLPQKSKMSHPFF